MFFGRLSFLCLQGPPPSKAQILFIFVVVSPSLTHSLLFWISLLFLLCDFPCLLGAFFLSFPGILGVTTLPQDRERKTPRKSNKARKGGADLSVPKTKSQSQIASGLGIARARSLEIIKNLLMPLFLMGCVPVDVQEVKRPPRTKSAKRPIKVGKRPIKEGKRPIKAMVLVGSRLLNGQLSGTAAMAENGPSKKAHLEVYDRILAERTGFWLRNRISKLLALFHRILKPQCGIEEPCLAEMTVEFVCFEPKKKLYLQLKLIGIQERIGIWNERFSAEIPPDLSL